MNQPKPDETATRDLLRDILALGLEALSAEFTAAANVLGSPSMAEEVLGEFDGRPLAQIVTAMSRSHLKNSEEKLGRIGYAQAELRSRDMDCLMTEAATHRFVCNLDARGSFSDGSPEVSNCTPSMLARLCAVPDKEQDEPGVAPCWIETLEPDDPDVKPVYDELLSCNGRHYNLYRASSLRPDPILGADAHYRASLHDKRNALPEWVLELLSTQVAILADCRYARENHGRNFVRLYGDDAEGRAMLEAVRRRDYGSLFEPREKALLIFGEKLALRPDAVRRQDIERLRAVGLMDVEILEAVQATAGFSYWARYINGLGIKLADEQIGRKGI